MLKPDSKLHNLITSINSGVKLIHLKIEKRLENKWSYLHPGSLNLEDDCYLFTFTYCLNNICINYITYLQRTRYGFWETHCEHLPTKCKNFGLGITSYILMFELAKEFGYDARSSRYPSPEALRVWKSRRLRKLYKIKKTNNRYKLYYNN